MFSATFVTLLGHIAYLSTIAPETTRRMPLEGVLSTVDAFNSEIGSEVALEVQNSPTPLKIDLRGYRQDYFRIGDPTEYKFATRCFPGGWEGWQACINSQEYFPIIEGWRGELAVKLRSDALSRIMEAAQGETRDALGANKYLYETLGNKTEDKKVGRPSKEAITKEATRLVEEDKIREEAYRRLFDAKEEI